MKKLITTILFGSCLVLTSFCIRLYRNSLIIPPEPEPKLFVEKFMELQREAGCKLIDAKVGPEVKLLFNAKAEEELPEYYNKCAAPYYTASGAPRKEVITHRIRNPPSGGQQ